MTNAPEAGHTVYIVDRLEASGEFRVIPPATLVKTGDVVTFRNFTRYDVTVSFPGELTKTQHLPLKANPADRPSITVSGSTGPYEYTVEVTLNGRTLPAKGLSGPMMIVD
jgi:plastocyanin